MMAHSAKARLSVLATAPGALEIKPVAIKEPSAHFTTASSPSSETSFTALVHVEKLSPVRLLPRLVL
jgi:hypothetical protein